MKKTKISQNFSFQREKKKINPLKILVFVLILILGLQTATQFAAHRFGYSHSLGSPLFMINTYPVYGFWKAVSWFMALRKYYDTNRMVGETFAFAGYITAFTFFGAAIAMRLLFLKSGMSAQEALHGTAHWAEKREIIEASLLDKNGKENQEGVVVGGWWDGSVLGKNKLKVLRSNGPEHVIAFAPTRSGKGVGLVLPTLLGNWFGSTLVLDIKGENWAMSAGYRKNVLGQEVYHFDPADPLAATKGTSVTFNPLEEIELDYEQDEKTGKFIQVRGGETAAIQNLASIIADPEGKGLSDHWAKTGHALLVGTITHMLYYGLANGFCPSLSDIAQEFSKPGEDWISNMEGWQQYPHLGYNEHGEPICHPVVAAAAQEMLNRDPKEGSSVLSTAVGFLSLYHDSVIANNTRVSSFKIKDLMDRDKPVNLYLVIKPIDLARLQPFIRLFVTQVVNKLADEMEFSGGKAKMKHKHRLLMMLDEFPSLGKLPIFERAIAFVASYGLKIYLITQDVAQLYASYSREESIMSNCHIRIAYAPNKMETAEMLSKMSGVTTVIKEAVSESGKRTDVFHNNTSVSIQEVQRPLLTADECMRLKGAKKNTKGEIEVPGDMLVFTAGFAPIYGMQKLFFMDKELSERSRIEAPKLSDHTLDMQARQKEIKEIKDRLKKENDEDMRIKKQINAAMEAKNMHEAERLQKELEKIRYERNKARPAKSRPAPVQHL